VAGCTVLYWLGKWKGKPYLDRKYSRSKLESILRVYQRYGMFALIVPALLPPPFPFKVFVLTAGICGLSFPRFLIALAAGRGFRYFFEATIAIRYGDRALAYLEQNYMQVAFVLIAVIVVCLGAYLLMNHVWKRGRSAPEQPIAVPDPD
jgi:membrane protein DedA with SNARE-associated domain